MDQVKAKKMAQISYTNPGERRKFLKYLKNIDGVVRKSQNYGPILNKYSKAIIDRHMPDVKKARKELSILQSAYNSYGRVTDSNINLNNDTHIFYQYRKLTVLLKRMRKLHEKAKKLDIRITKNVNGKRIYKTEKELKRELR